MLEPLSAGIIGTRMFYLVNFFCSFARADGNSSDAAPVTTDTITNPFISTVVQLVESVYAASAAPATRLDDGLFVAGGGGSRRTIAASLPTFGDSPGRQHQQQQQQQQQTSFIGSAERFLVAVLEQMVRMLGLEPTVNNALLLLDEDADGYPVWHRATATAGNTNSESISAAEALETAVWLLSRRDDVAAEGYLLGIIETTNSRMPPPLPPPLQSSSTSVTREARALARCASYHLSRIWERRGDSVRAGECMRLAVEGSLFFDSFVGWNEAEFLFA